VEIMTFAKFEIKRKSINF